LCIGEREFAISWVRHQTFKRSQASQGTPFFYVSSSLTKPRTKFPDDGQVRSPVDSLGSEPGILLAYHKGAGRIFGARPDNTAFALVKLGFYEPAGGFLVKTAGGSTN